MRFTVESWAPEYGLAADSEHLEEATGDVVLYSERAEGRWSAVDPAPHAEPVESVVFVDGVRRIDARIWITDGDGVRPGVCASVAAGAVRCDPDAARVVGSRVFRALYARASHATVPIATRHGTYELVPCAADGPDDLYRAIHDQMTALETRIVPPEGTDEGDAVLDPTAAQIIPPEGAELVVFDGPIRGRGAPAGVGYVKTQHVQYLPDREQRVISTLRAGQRTPLFFIGGSGFARWSWYLRLPAVAAHPWSGIVRCEMASPSALADAVCRADAVSALLPRYASQPHKDARAPQNLYPIAGLENELRRLLGSRHVMERALRVAAM